MKIVIEYIVSCILLTMMTIVPFLVDKFFMGDLKGYSHLLYYILTGALFWIVIQKVLSFLSLDE